jgi:hypothetical protein
MQASQQLLESLPFFWGVAFVINITVGTVLFVAIMRQTMPSWSTGVTCWVAWWAFATAISLLINVISGPNAPFSYHQMGILTETMTNIGILLWVATFSVQNWGVRGDDWDRLNALRKKINLGTEPDDEPK